jgi:hypothetical protein
MKVRAHPYALVALVVLAGGVAWLECGGGAVCGDGKVEADEQCDVGALNGGETSGCGNDCRYSPVAIASIQVSYTKLIDEVPGFTGAACIDLGIGSAHMVLTGPKGADEEWMGCTQSKMYADVPPGTYQATITLFDTAGAALTKPIATALTDVKKGPVTTLNINFHQDDFLKQDYTGLLDWNPSWGLKDKKCADSAVTSEAVTLADAKGAPVMMPSMTSDGIKINGPAGGCFSKSATTLFQRIGPLPWGKYKLGLVGAGASPFCKTFDVFVPPGVAPMTYELVVDAYDPGGDGGACP